MTISLSDNAKGAVFMMASMIGFILNDALFKLAVSDLALFQAIMLRGIAATAFVALLAWHFKALRFRPAPRDRKLIFWRVISEVGGTASYLTALSQMPIANATAILQVIPLAVTFAAAMLLGERVGWRRYSAIAIGFLGVLLIVRPGATSFDTHAIWAVTAVVFLVARDLITRRLSPEVPSLYVSTLTSIFITLFATVLMPWHGWMPVTPEPVIFLLAASVCLIAGYTFGVMTMRVGEIAFVSPFRYSILIWSILLGIVVFGDWPDELTMIGAAIVVATGLYSFYRERKLAGL